MIDVNGEGSADSPGVSTPHVGDRTPNSTIGSARSRRPIAAFDDQYHWHQRLPSRNSERLRTPGTAHRGLSPSPFTSLNLGAEPGPATPISDRSHTARSPTSTSLRARSSASNRTDFKPRPSPPQLASRSPTAFSPSRGHESRHYLRSQRPIYSSRANTPTSTHPVAPSADYRGTDALGTNAGPTVHAAVPQTDPNPAARKLTDLPAFGDPANARTTADAVPSLASFPVAVIPVAADSLSSGRNIIWIPYSLPVPPNQAYPTAPELSPSADSNTIVAHGGITKTSQSTPRSANLWTYFLLGVLLSIIAAIFVGHRLGYRIRYKACPSDPNRLLWPA